MLCVTSPATSSMSFRVGSEAVSETDLKMRLFIKEGGDLRCVGWEVNVQVADGIDSHAVQNATTAGAHVCTDVCRA
jgi:hypothetical protein